jgi:DNA-binding NarL/FixJ family response regulator
MSPGRTLAAVEPDGTTATRLRPIRVVIADDQELFRTGVGMLIESQPDLELVGSAASGREAVSVVESTEPDVVLMDIRMPGVDGLAATELILAGTADPPPRILVVTTFRRDEAVARAIRAGASGFLTKDADPEFLLAAIRTVHAGQAVIAPAATFDLLRQFGQAPRPAREHAIAELSPREKEIFVLLAKGLSNAEIAASAFVSETTVKTHVGSILAKLGLRSRVQLVAFAWENGLVG